MPRHNNRKHYPNEGKFNFEPVKYIGTNPSRRNQKLCSSIRVDKVSGRRHFGHRKAHAPTKKQRRVLAEIKQMHKNAKLVWARMSASPISTSTTPTPAPSTITPIND